MKMRERKHLFWWLPRAEMFVRSHRRKVKPLPQTYWVGKGGNAYLQDKKNCMLGGIELYKEMRHD
jgi:hypothetical protein